MLLFFLWELGGKLRSGEPTKSDCRVTTETRRAQRKNMHDLPGGTGKPYDISANAVEI
jgi:hypothetical protein